MKNLILFSLLFISLSINAQDNSFDTSKSYHEDNISIGVSPMEMLIGRYRIFGAYGLTEKHSMEASVGAIQSNLYAYPSGSNYFENGSTDYMRGYFLDVAHRYYLHRDQRNNFIYLRTSAFFNNAVLEGTTQGWISEEREGIEYFRYGSQEQTTDIQTVGGRLEAGVEVTGGAFFFDFLFGLAYEELVTEPHYETFDRPNIFDLEYEGFSPSLNFRIGFMLN